MDEAVRISVWNAYDGLHLTSDLAFYAAEIKCGDLYNAVRTMHAQQLTADSYGSFVDTITDGYLAKHHQVLTWMMPCAVITSGYRQIMRWFNSAYQVAVNMLLDTLGVENSSPQPRLVPHNLRNLWIESAEQIDRDVLWRILTTEPWLSFAERARAQYARMSKALSISNGIERLPHLMQALVDQHPTESATTHQLIADERADKRSIRKAFKLHDRLFGSRHLRSLLSDTLTLTGHLYNYSLWMDKGDLLRRTRKTNAGVPPIHIAINRKGTEQALCTFCVYFEDTPLLDFVTAFMLHLMTEENELDLLRTGQVQNLTRFFFDDPLLPDLKNLHDPVMAPTGLISNIAIHAIEDSQHVGLRSKINVASMELVEELLGYPPAVLDLLRDGQQYAAWDLIEGVETAKDILDRAKNLFR